MSEMADEFIKRIEFLRNAENTFYFDGDSIVLVPKDLENMNKLREFEAARVQGIENNLRKKIAGEIEKMLNKYPDNSFQDGFNHALTLSAEIARG
jgi:hypothetical protein